MKQLDLKKLAEKILDDNESLIFERVGDSASTKLNDIFDDLLADLIDDIDINIEVLKTWLFKKININITRQIPQPMTFEELIPGQTFQLKEDTEILVYPENATNYQKIFPGSDLFDKINCINIATGYATFIDNNTTVIDTIFEGV